jgi:hypothetical protein
MARAQQDVDEGELLSVVISPSCAKKGPPEAVRQVAKAEKAVAGKVPVKRNRFITLTGATKTVNRQLEAEARALSQLGEPPRCASVMTAALQSAMGGMADRHGGPVIVQQTISPPVRSVPMAQF